MSILSKTLSALALCGFVAACSSGGGGSSSPSISSSLSTMSAKMTAFSNLMGGSSTSADPIIKGSSLDFYPRTAISSVWTTGSSVPNLYNGNSYSLQQWFIDEFDENFQNSNGAYITFGGRVKNALDILCYLPALGIETDSSNLPAPGVYEVTITPSISSSCGGDFTSDVSATITVSSTTDSTLYTRFLSIALAGTNCPFNMYAKVSSAAINIAQAEDQSCDGRDHASRTVFLYDIFNKTTRFFYYSKAFDTDNNGFDNSGFEVYRGYLNEATDEAYVVGFYGGDNDGDSTFESGVSFTAAGKPTAGGTVAVSAYTNFSSNPVAGGTYEGCIEPTAMTVSSDDLSACTVAGTDAAATHASVIQALYNSSEFTTRSAVSTINETTSVGFTDNTDMFN